MGLGALDVSNSLLSIGYDFGIKKPLIFGGVLWSPKAKLLANRKKIDIHNYTIPNPNPEDPLPKK